MTLPGLIKRLSGNTSGLSEDDFWHQAGRCEQMLYRAAIHYSGNRFDAEDLVQETFMAGFRNRHQLKDRRKMKSWLFVILRNRFLKRAQHQTAAAEETYNDAVDYIDALEEFAQREDVLQILERRSTAENVNRWLKTLPERYQSVLILYYLKEFSYQEIADILEIPMGTVMSRISRGKQRFKSAMMREASRARTSGNVISMARKG